MEGLLYQNSSKVKCDDSLLIIGISSKSTMQFYITYANDIHTRNRYQKPVSENWYRFLVRMSLALGFFTDRSGKVPHSCRMGFCDLPQIQLQDFLFILFALVTKADDRRTILWASVYSV